MLSYKQLKRKKNNLHHSNISFRRVIVSSVFIIFYQITPELYSSDGDFFFLSSLCINAYIIHTWLRFEPMFQVSNFYAVASIVWGHSNRSHFCSTIFISKSDMYRYQEYNPRPSSCKFYHPTCYTRALIIKFHPR